MEPCQGMTRHSVRRVLRMIIRRWYLPFLFAIVFALAFSYFFLFKYYPTYQVSSTLIPLNADYFKVTALIENDEVLEAVSNSVDFDISIDDLKSAISYETDENSAAISVHISWNNQDQAFALFKAFKANLTFAITYSANAGEIKWMDAASSNIQIASSAAQSYELFIIGAVVGLLAGAGFAFILGSLDKRVFDLETVNYGNDAKVIGVISRSKSLSAPSKSRRHAAQTKHGKDLVAIALYLNKLKETKSQQLILCSAPTKHSGTSTIIRQLARVFHDIEANTLIITINSSGPSKTGPDGRLEIRAIYPGVDECVLSRTEWDRPPAPEGLMAVLLTFARKRYKFILVDYPALLENIHISMLARRTDATLLVCRYGKTKYADVRAALTLLLRSDSTPIHCVWNFADKRYDHLIYPAQGSTGSREGSS